MKLALAFPYRENPNRPDVVLLKSLRAWMEQDRADLIILVDGSRKKTNLPDINILNHIHIPYDGPFNLSFMRNVGARAAIEGDCELIHMMDSDIFPKKGYLNKVVDFMEEVDIVQPYVINSSKSISGFEKTSDKTYLDFINLVNAKKQSSRHSTSTILQRVSVVKELNGYDEAYEVWGGEDDDYCRRAQQAGFKISKYKEESLIHSWHIQDTKNKAKGAVGAHARNRMRYVATVKGKLPIKRMPDDWGLSVRPRPEVSVELK